MRLTLMLLVFAALLSGCSIVSRKSSRVNLPEEPIPTGVGHPESDSRGIQYVDYVPTPEEIKEHLEADGWQEVRIVQALPDFLQGPIRALSLFDLQSNLLPSKSPQEYGRISGDRIRYLNLEFGAGGIVTAPLVLPDGARAITFHVAVKQHYVMIIWNPAERAGYVWRSFIYGTDGAPTEMRFLMQRQDLERI